MIDDDNDYDDNDYNDSDYVNDDDDAFLHFITKNFTNDARFL